MEALRSAVARYLDIARALGATDVDRLATECLPASVDDLDRLDEHLGGEVPGELRSWFLLCNGIDLDLEADPQPVERVPMVFPGWLSYSLDFLLDNIGWLTERFAEPPEEGPNMIRPFPILLSDNTTRGMFVECAAHDGRLVYCGEIEACGDHNGYYHPTITSFVHGCIHNAIEGRYEVRAGGIATPLAGAPPHDPFLFPINFWEAGFRKQDGLPPRLPWPRSSYDGVDVTRPAPDRYDELGRPAYDNDAQ